MSRAGKGGASPLGCWSEGIRRGVRMEVSNQDELPRMNFRSLSKDGVSRKREGASRQREGLGLDSPKGGESCPG